MRTLFSLLLFCSFCSAAWAEPVNLKYGVNNVDINADGVPDMIVKARWENGNAHSFNRYFVMMNIPESAGYSDGFYEVPLGEIAGYSFTTVEGADCLRTGFRFELNKQKVLRVIKYSLKPSEDYFCGKSVLTETVYELEKRTGFDIGVPYYLKDVKRKTYKGVYATVEDRIE